MSKEHDELNGVIDEALQRLTSGAPSQGLRRRVLARIWAAEPAPSRLVRLAGPRAHPLGWAAIVALAAVALAGSLLLSRFPQPRHEGTGGTVTAALHVSPPLHATEVAIPPAGAVESVTSSGVATRRLPKPVLIPDESVTPPPAANDEEAHPGETIRIDPLPIPIPIADRPIEIEPLGIQPIANREIQIPLIESNRPRTGPGQPDKR